MSLDVLKRYWDLGFTSFGGPGVHVVILRQRFVEKYKWLEEVTFIDLFALGNALPGPGSTQLAFSIAVVCRGILPGFFAFFLWSLPGAIGMAGLAAGISRIPDTLPPLVLALLSGLNAAAVGLIALAAMQLGTAASTDKLTTSLVWLSASFGICYHAPWMYPVLIAVGGVATLLWDFRRQLLAPLRRKIGRHEQTNCNGNREVDEHESTNGSPHELSEVPSVGESRADRRSVRSTTSLRSVAESNGLHDVSGRQRIPSPEEPIASVIEPNPLQTVPTKAAIAFLVAFILFLTVPLATRAGLKNAGRPVPRVLDFFSNMIIAGTIIFGGGPVVIPLLRDYVVVEGWVSSRDFLLVFAILQAFPGPNFNFAVALGFLAVPQHVLGAFLGYIGIFTPGILLKLALLPMYSTWRSKALARSIIRGLNAAASGLVFTAVWQLFLVGYIYEPAEPTGQAQTLSGPLTSDPFWAVICSGAFVITRWGMPAWGAIALGGLAGMAWFGVRSS